MKRRLLLASISLAILLLVPTMAFAISQDAKSDFALRLKPMGKPTGKPIPPMCEIVDPTDGQTLEHGIYRVLVSASSSKGIASVTLSINGVVYDITSNFDGTYYYYDWEITADGDYTLKAIATDNRHKKTSHEIIVHVGGSPPPGKWAVVIGIADYEGRDSDLWNPDNDAKEMEKILVENGYSSSNIRKLLNRDATANAIVSAVDWLIDNEGPDDEVVFFFSGHGYRAPDNDGWDSDSESDGHDEMIVTHDLYGLPDGWFASKFTNLESTNVAMIFCQCHSGGMFDDNSDSGITGTGRVIVSACKADQYGWDYRFLRNTLFFYYWGDEGLLQDNAYSVESAYAYAYPLVTAEQPDSQPQLWDNYSGEFNL